VEAGAPEGRGDHIITSGGLKEQRGFLIRDQDGRVTGADLAGQPFTRMRAA
jgi:hypothetical protein